MRIEKAQLWIRRVGLALVWVCGALVVSIAAEASPKVVFSNDGELDAYALEFALALASLNQIELLGIIADAGTGYVPASGHCPRPVVWEAGRAHYAEIVRKARNSGMQNLPDPVAGANCPLKPPPGPCDNAPTGPTLEVCIDQTPALDGGVGTPASRLIRDLILDPQNGITAADPLIVVTGGPLTAVADAYLLAPSIADRLVVLSYLGSSSDMNDYNGQVDGWAAAIVLKRLRYGQYPLMGNTWDPHIPKACLASSNTPAFCNGFSFHGSFPVHELRRFMYDKVLPENGLPGDYSGDATPIVALVDPTFDDHTRRIAFSGWNAIYGAERYGNGYRYLPRFETTSAGHAVVVNATGSNHAMRSRATNAWWQAVANPAAYSGVRVQQSPYAATDGPVQLPARIEAEQFDWGGEGHAYHDSQFDGWGAWQGWRNTDRPEFEATLDVDGGLNVRSFDAGEWLEYTVHATTPATFLVRLRVAATSSSLLQLGLDCGDGSSGCAQTLGPVTVPGTGSGQAWVTIDAGSLPMSAGEHVLRVSVLQNRIHLNYIELAETADSVECEPLSKIGWSLVSVDSEETIDEAGHALHAFDDDPWTNWVTEWAPPQGHGPGHPHALRIDLGAARNLCGMTYLPRQDGVNGTVKDYRLFVSLDQVQWQLASSGVLVPSVAAGRAERELLFAPTMARFVQFVAVSEVNGNVWTTTAEIGLKQQLGVAPEPTPGGRYLELDSRAAPGVVPSGAKP